jgi:hypothetical protein
MTAMSVRLVAALLAALALAAALWLIVGAIRRHRWSSLLRVVPALCDHDLPPLGALIAAGRLFRQRLHVGLQPY